MANPYEQMAQSLGEAGVNLSGTKTYSNYEKSQKLAGGDRDDPPPTRPRARPESKDTSESPTISIVDADTDETVGTWNVGSGDVTFSGDSSLSETTQQRKKSKSGLAVPEPKINIGPLEIKERDAKLDVSMDWSNVFDNLLKDAMPKGVNLDRFKTSWDGETIKLLDVGMSFAEGGKVSDKAQLEMELIMNEQVDPVSGNTAPIGAKPEEVRDDVEIRVSPGEYVVNAQTVRYFGEEFFDELQKAAAEGFKRIKEGEELPFRDDELDIEDDETEEVEPEGFAHGGRVKGYAEGDLVVPQPVGGGYGQYGGTGAMFTGYQSKTYINDETGQKIVIFFFNGRPLSRIPAGFREMGETPAEEQEIKETATVKDTTNASEGIADEIKQSEINWRSKNPKDWDENEYNSYYRDLKSTIDKGEDPLGLSTAEELVTTLLGGPVGALGKVLGAETGLGSLIKKSKKNQAQKVFDTIANMETATNVQRDTQYLLGGALGIEGYAKPYTKDELDEFGMPTEQALKDRGTPSMQERVDAIALKGSLAPDTSIRPRARPDSAGVYGTEGEVIKPATLPKAKGKYDPTKASAAGGATKNTLNAKEQAAFDAAVDRGDDSGVNHYVAINRLRNKQDAFFDEGMSRAQGAAMGLSTYDMDQAEKFGGSVHRATTSKEEGGLGTHALQKNPLSPAREKSDNDTAEDKSGDKVLCDLIHRYGYLDEDIWRLDEAFGNRVAIEDPELMEGYHTWAKPMVAWVEKESFLAKLYLKYWCVPFTRRWANHIAHIMEPENYKPDYVGKLMLAIGVPISRAIYKLKGRKLKTV